MKYEALIYEDFSPQAQTSWVSREAKKSPAAVNLSRFSSLGQLPTQATSLESLRAVKAASRASLPSQGSFGLSRVLVKGQDGSFSYAAAAAPGSSRRSLLDCRPQGSKEASRVTIHVSPVEPNRLLGAQRKSLSVQGLTSTSGTQAPGPTRSVFRQASSGAQKRAIHGQSFSERQSSSEAVRTSSEAGHVRSVNPQRRSLECLISPVDNKGRGLYPRATLQRASSVGEASFAVPMSITQRSPASFRLVPVPNPASSSVITISPNQNRTVLVPAQPMAFYRPLSVPSSQRTINSNYVQNVLNKTSSVPSNGLPAAPKRSRSPRLALPFPKDM